MDVIISALIEANKLLNKKDYYKALDCFECVLNINPTNNLAIIGKTICIHYLKSFDNISLINIYEEKLNVNLKLAELYECGKYDETITECNKILKKCSFKSENDLRNISSLATWLYIYGFYIMYPRN